MSTFDALWQLNLHIPYLLLLYFATKHLLTEKFVFFFSALNFSYLSAYLEILYCVYQYFLSLDICF